MLRCCWLHVVMAVQMRSHHYPPRSLRVPCVTWRFKHHTADGLSHQIIGWLKIWRVDKAKIVIPDLATPWITLANCSREIGGARLQHFIFQFHGHYTLLVCLFGTYIHVVWPILKFYSQLVRGTLFALGQRVGKLCPSSGSLLSWQAGRPRTATFNLHENPHNLRRFMIVGPSPKTRMSTESESHSAIVESVRGKARYTFSRVNMANLPAQLMPGLIMSKSGITMRLSLRLALFAVALGVGILVRHAGGDDILATFLAGVIAGGGFLFAAIISDQPVRDIIVTVSSASVKVQRSPYFLVAPVCVPRNDMLSVMLTLSFPGTFTADGSGSAMRLSSAIVLQRRSMAPYVLISGCSRESLAPLARYIAERFNLTLADTGSPPAEISPEMYPSASPCVHPSQQVETPNPTRPHAQPGCHTINNASTPGQWIDHLCYPTDGPDRRISITSRDGTLFLKVRRTSTFWQPTTLVAVALIEVPILTLALALGGWALHGMIVDLPGRYTGPGLGDTIMLLGLASTILIVTILAATKGTSIIAKPQDLTTFTTFFWRKRAFSLAVADIVTFGVRQSTISDLLGGNLVIHDLVVETKSRVPRSLLSTTRLSQQQIGALATHLRRFYSL